MCEPARAFCTLRGGIILVNSTTKSLVVYGSLTCPFACDSAAECTSAVLPARERLVANQRVRHVHEKRATNTRCVLVSRLDLSRPRYRFGWLRLVSFAAIVNTFVIDTKSGGFRTRMVGWECAVSGWVGERIGDHQSPDF